MQTSLFFRPGERVPVSGIYAEVNQLGTRTGRNVTCVKGEVFPPTQNNGYGYVLTQRTNP